MSLDALDPFFGMKSNGELVADTLQIRHCYCDPSREHQKKLGIKHPVGIGPSDSFNPCRHGINAEQKAEDAIRERFWLQKLLKLDVWPVLFICGANHTKTFPKLLRANKITVDVLLPNWEPN